MNRILPICLLMISSGIASAQLGVGTNTPDARAVLDLTSTTKGLLIPRMTSTERQAIASTPDGLQVYQTDDVAGLPAGLYYFRGGAGPGAGWNRSLTSGSDVLTADNGLTRTANSVQLGGTLTQATDIPMAGNDLSFSGAGRVGIGTTVAPEARLQVGSANPGTTVSNLKAFDEVIDFANVGIQNIMNGIGGTFAPTSNHTGQTLAMGVGLLANTDVDQQGSLLGTGMGVFQYGNGDFGGMQGMGGQIGNMGTGTILNATGIGLTVGNGGAGTITSATGIGGDVNTGPGTIGDATGVNGTVSNSSTMNSAKGISGGISSNGGSISNASAVDGTINTNGGSTTGFAVGLNGIVNNSGTNVNAAGVNTNVNNDGMITQNASGVNAGVSNNSTGTITSGASGVIGRVITSAGSTTGFAVGLEGNVSNSGSITGNVSGANARVNNNSGGTIAQNAIGLEANVGNGGTITQNVYGVNAGINNNTGGVITENATVVDAGLNNNGTITNYTTGIGTNINNNTGASMSNVGAVNANISNAGTITGSIDGFNANIQPNGGTIAFARGATVNINSGAGTITDATGFVTGGVNATANAIGVNINNINASAGNATGLLIDNINGTGNNFAISSNTSAKSYFNGFMGLGHSGPSTQLHVTPGTGLDPVTIDNLIAAPSATSVVTEVGGVLKTTTAAQLFASGVAANNGLTVNAGVIQLGTNALITDTDIPSGGNYLALSGTGASFGVATSSLTPPTTTLQVAGSMSARVRVGSAVTEAVAATDYFIILSNGATTNLTLPAAADFVGRMLFIKNTSGNTVTTSANYLDYMGTGINTIANITAVHLISDGTNWQAITN